MNGIMFSPGNYSQYENAPSSVVDFGNEIQAEEGSVSEVAREGIHGSALMGGRIFEDSI